MEQVERLQSYLQVLGDMNRLRILNFLGDRECSVSEIVEAMNMSQPLVSHHLKVLKTSQIVETQRSGPFIHYRLRNIKLLDVLGLFEEMLPKEDIVTESRPVFRCPSWWRAFNRQ